MNTSENYIFQIIDIIQAEKPWVVAGLVFDTITKDDLLSLFSMGMGYITVRVIGITFYGKQADEITRGNTARLILDSETDLLISNFGYLYKQN